MNWFTTCLNIKHENIQIILDSDIKRLFVTIHNNDIRRTVVSEVTSYFPLQSRQLTMGAQLQFHELLLKDHLQVITWFVLY